MKLLQVCNVGRIVGGTAACAWSVTRALPDVEHHVAFLSSITDDTRAAFAGVQLHRCERLTNRLVRDLGIDCVILHNTAASRTERISAAWTMQYVHSRGTRAPADCTRYCSRWLADACLRSPASCDDVLYQCVPRPTSPELRSDSGRLVVGRICAPTAAKWPRCVVEFYAVLARQHPAVEWEFVGCPGNLQPEILNACNGRAVFHSAGWTARLHLARWDALLYHHPTLTESFGRTVAEAMRSGCVPIVDARGGFLEQVTPETGRLCSVSGDFSSAFEALSQGNRRKQLAHAGRLRADELFSMAAFRRRLFGLWKGASVGASRKLGGRRSS